ncbi:diacylglyceryl transferase [Gordoniibacillus kamchatkensis]|uniref:Phosphatidylglycerol--prolipoprotein diacylglyceryl transferase n=1 Tax=Gordoniibacillus kamchatkensis TaxID=1590651 RepID=A0ABR5AEF7_9BACL|nr:prolipoprotein diacylglyceryl transferase [Paenibacillus sp. VKM B-2647]KIL39351.1 diacylglyceryl transferase [Paenibacillus sp. VKM B-2647]
MRVVLFSIGDFPVRAYGTVIAAAILLSLGVAFYLAKGTEYRKHLWDVVIYVILGAIVGARLWEVVFFEGAYYSQHLIESFAIWKGGLSIQGGLIGGFTVGLIYCWRKKINFWKFADIMAPAIVFGQGVGRIACLLNGDAFGSPTGSNFGLVYPPGTIAYETYGSQPLWPAEVWEGQWDFIVFGILLILKNRFWPRGFLFLSYNILYSLGRFMLEMLRGDTPRYLFDFTAAQWTSVTVILISLVFILWNYFYEKKPRAL